MAIKLDGKIDGSKLQSQIDALKTAVGDEKYAEGAVERKEAMLMLSDAIEYFAHEYDREQKHLAFKPKPSAYNQRIHEGHVYETYFDVKSIGSELRDMHRALVISKEKYRHTNTVIVAPITSANAKRDDIEKAKKDEPNSELALFMVPFEGSDRVRGYIDVRQTRAISVARINVSSNGLPVDEGAASEACMRKVKDALLQYIDAGKENEDKLLALAAEKAAINKLKSQKHKALAEAKDMLLAAKNPSFNTQEYIQKALDILEEGMLCDKPEQLEAYKKEQKIKLLEQRAAQPVQAQPYGKKNKKKK